MNSKLLKAKLKLARKQQRDWLKAYNAAERALERIGKRIDVLEKRLGLANP